MKTLYHVFSRGERTLFRNEADYIFFCNRFAINSHRFCMNPLALTVMSTHFHAIVEPSDPEDLPEFFSNLKRPYMIYYSNRYSPPKGRVAVTRCS